MAEEDWAQLLGRGTQFAVWQLQPPKDGKESSEARITLTFYKARLYSVEPLRTAALTVDQRGRSVNGAFIYHLQAEGKDTFLVGHKGALLAEDAKIPYTLKDDVLKLEGGRVKLAEVGEVSLQGEWKKVKEE
jgi:hypothetical protein